MKPPKIRRLVVIDFDGTLVFTPSPETLVEGTPALDHYDAWLEIQGLPERKWRGWWGRSETLLPPIFGRHDGDAFVAPPELLNQDLARQHAQYRADPENLVVLMTGRHRGMKHPNGEHLCKVILDAYGLGFDRYFYNSSGKPTLAFKCGLFDEHLDEFPTIEEVEIFEDRMAHASMFDDWIKRRRKEGHIKAGRVVRVYPPEPSFGEVGGEE